MSSNMQTGPKGATGKGNNLFGTMRQETSNIVSGKSSKPMKIKGGKGKK